MEANKILDADVLDLIFENRNKEYGAYILRKTYSRRLLKAFCGTMATVGFVVGGYVMAESAAPATAVVYTIDSVHLQPPPADPVEPPPPVVPPPQAPQVEVVKVTPPLIVPDKLVTPEEMPPANATLEDVKIGDINVDGVKDIGIVAPPVEDGNRDVITAPEKVSKEPDIWTKVEVESQYPGGTGAWMRYLNKTFQYPEAGQANGVAGTVVVQFVVDQEGNVSQAEATSGPVEGGLREEAVRVIRKSGRWEPAIQNGRKVKSYKSQPIIFRLNIE